MDKVPSAYVPSESCFLFLLGMKLNYIYHVPLLLDEVMWQSSGQWDVSKLDLSPYLPKQISAAHFPSYSLTSIATLGVM